MGAIFDKILKYKEQPQQQQAEPKIETKIQESKIEETKTETKTEQTNTEVVVVEKKQEGEEEEPKEIETKSSEEIEPKQEQTEQTEQTEQPKQTEQKEETEKQPETPEIPKSEPQPKVEIEKESSTQPTIVEQQQPILLFDNEKTLAQLLAIFHNVVTKGLDFRKSFIQFGFVSNFILTLLRQPKEKSQHQTISNLTARILCEISIDNEAKSEFRKENGIETVCSVLTDVNTSADVSQLCLRILANVCMNEQNRKLFVSTLSKERENVLSHILKHTNSVDAMQMLFYVVLVGNFGTKKFCFGVFN